MSDMQRVVITGGLSGLGLALARHYASKGATLLLADLNDDAAETVLDELSGIAAAVTYQHCDVASTADVEALALTAKTQMSGCDILINNAGVASSGSLLETDDEEWLRLIDIDLLSVMRGCRAFLPMMKEQRKGHLVNIASIAGLILAPGMMTYNVAKAGVIALSETLRGEVVDDGIGVTVVCPAFFKTNLVASMDTTSDALKSRINHLMEHSGVSADDVASMIGQAVNKGQFMLLTDKNSRRQDRIRRWFPEWMFRLKRKHARQMFNSEKAND